MKSFNLPAMAIPSKAVAVLSQMRKQEYDQPFRGNFFSNPRRPLSAAERKRRKRLEKIAEASRRRNRS